ncbi:Os05g0195500 [Oryza sativa Japonica Group]|uniref:Os05g0195500 protein n=2 Tax=Oryza sativa subsp. japonica TaxID=39947 RepID=B7EKN7_ORYSJ|nr:unnamed protein product [Oryza sativa Japonica Group]BAH92992.1 Os05g0195400 [Oryza sativa Japonica Group]BAS92669.1 Os05g0195500 [Oryza sativa Japonica Group]|eukprot:NP_001174264.1 Os05g0195400 [Oryza sativa Japonica Group]
MGGGGRREVAAGGDGAAQRRQRRGEGRQWRHTATASGASPPLDLAGGETVGSCGPCDEVPTGGEAVGSRSWHRAPPRQQRQAPHGGGAFE